MSVICTHVVKRNVRSNVAKMDKKKAATNTLAMGVYRHFKNYSDQQTNWEGHTQTAIPISMVNYLAMGRILEISHLEVGYMVDLTHVTGVRLVIRKRTRVQFAKSIDVIFSIFPKN